jgi:very-short-patch-repair endonuclease
LTHLAPFITSCGWTRQTHVFAGQYADSDVSTLEVYRDGFWTRAPYVQSAAHSMAQVSDGEEFLWGLLRILSLSSHPLPMPQRQVGFDSKRKWAFDFAWVEHKLALEVDGGTWSRGRHNRGAGYEEDCKKINEATCQGWRVLRVTTKQVESGEAIDWIERMLK